MTRVQSTNNKQNLNRTPPSSHARVKLPKCPRPARSLLYQMKRDRKSHVRQLGEETLSSMSMASPSSSQTLAPTLDHLGHDHLTSILLLLPRDAILSFALTCKKFKSLAFSDVPLWEMICRRDWGSETVDSFLATLTDAERRELSYRKLYERVSVLKSLSCRRLVCQGGAFPNPRASHSLNLVSDWLVLFGGGCEGGRYRFSLLDHYFFLIW